MPHVSYYGSRISDNLARTPEGFLICRNVPIARTGIQKYLGSEMHLDDNQIHEVERMPDDVFSAETIASFEGKPFTDDHPPGDRVEPDNASWVTKGAVQNVRRGSGEDADKLLADIVVYDKTTIMAIEDGKREISCGYECIYEPVEGGKYRQTGIVGNHVALVKKGRAGERIAIKDQQLEQEVEKNMPEKKSKKGFWGKIIGLVKDNAPEDMEMAIDEMRRSLTADEDGGELTKPASAPVVPPENRPENPVKDEEPGENPLAERLDKVEALLMQVVKHLEPKSEPDALDALEEELTGKAADEAGEECKNPEEVKTGDEEGSKVIENDPEPEDRKAAADSLSMLRQMKPIVAAIKDPQQRKTATDTLAKLIRSQMGVAAPQKTGAYSNLLQAKHQTKDSDEKVEDVRDMGHQWAADFNPHYKKEGK